MTNMLVSGQESPLKRMEIVADLHLHSKYSRAVSPQMVIPQMAKWAKIKGIDLLGTGDFTHPRWLGELKETLEEKEGVFFLKGEKCEVGREGGSEGGVKFLLTTEISSIYSQAGKTRKIHNLIITPSFSTVEKINSELKRRGCNISSDGRPIVGLSAKSVAEIVLSIDEKCLIIPAHIWTPWFSLFGANSGFDSLEECFGSFSKYIFAVETGLSSDPAMNWRVADLDDRSIVSFSDAHSPGNLGREATILSINNWCYEEIVGAIRGDKGKKGNAGIRYTIEFYPEEGKYHYTGHRNCKVVFSPQETKKKGTTCPVCGKGLTVGVMDRVGKIGRLGKVGEIGEIDKFGVKWVREGSQKEQKKKERPCFVKLVPLADILAEVRGVGKLTQGVAIEYERLIKTLGNELTILISKKAEEIVAIGGEKLAEGIMKVRCGDIFIQPGFDGEYGKVKVWGGEGVGGEGKDERETSGEQIGLF